MKLQLVADLLARRSESNPDRLLYTFLSQDGGIVASWTCAQLHERAVSIARQVRRLTDAGDRVLLPCGTAMEFIAPFFACLYSGVIPAPLPSIRNKRELPRFRAIALDSGATLAIGSSQVTSKIEELGGFGSLPSSLRWLCDDGMDGAASAVSVDEARRTAPDPAVAYLQYTSGSTSQPKGVLITNEGALHNLSAIDADFQHSEQSIGVTWLPHFHDMGLVYGLLQPLFNGYHAYVLNPAHVVQNPVCWLRAITRYRATHSGGPNFAYDLCVRRISTEAARELDLQSWRVAFNGAEVIRADTIESFARTFAPSGFRKSAFYLAYGLAEATLKVSGRAIDASGQSYSTPGSGSGGGHREYVSCGFPALGTEIQIVDPETRARVAPGGVGEVWVRSRSVARGYWNSEEATQTSFQASTQGDETAKTYLRTGDFGFIRDRELYITGRLKDVLIVRGQNHFPEDIEWTAQKAHPALAGKRNAVFAVDSHNEERVILVHEVDRRYRDQLPQAESAIRQAVAETHGLKISTVCFVNAGHVPATTSGKVMRRACRSAFEGGSLPAIHQGTLQDEAIPAADGDLPASPVGLSKHLMRLAGKILHVTLGERDADRVLTEFGLDSVTALEFCHAVERDFGVEISLPKMLAASVADIAFQISSSDSVQPQAAPVIQGHQAKLRPSISSEQERLWLMHAAAPHTSAYNLRVGLRIRGGLDLCALRTAVNRTVRRAAVLGTAFAEVDGKLVATIAEREVPLAVCDLTDGAVLASKAADRSASAAANESFDLRSGPLIRALLLRIARDEHVLAIAVHHIVADMWSLRLLVRDTLDVYGSIARGEPPVLPEVRRTYAEFVDRCRPVESDGFLRRISFWRDQLAHVSAEAIPLPLDAPRGRHATHAAEELCCMLDSETCAGIGALARNEGSTPFVVMLSAFAILLNRCSRWEDIIIATPVVNRDQAEFGEVFGLFAQPLPVRIDLSGNPKARELVRRARTAVLSTIEKPIVPYARLAEMAGAARTPTHLPLAQTIFGLRKPCVPECAVDGLQVEPVAIPGAHTDFDLFLDVVDDAGSFEATLRYRCDAFKRGTAGAILASYVSLLRQIVAKPDQHLDLFELEPELVNKGCARDFQDDTESLQVAATFTAEPLDEYIAFWSKMLGVPVEPRFAPFGQVIQSILAASPQPATLLLLRAEDWLKEAPPAKQIVEEFVHTLRAAAAKNRTHYLVCICPKSPAAARTPDLSAAADAIESELARACASIPQVVLLRGGRIADSYSIDLRDDAAADEMAAVPYTPGFYAAIATEVFRSLYALRRRPVKVIACDCDGTLWSGSCAEDGPEGVQFTDGHRGLYDRLKELARAGVLLTLCSRNEAADVKEVFDRRRELGLAWSDFTAMRINWNRKSDNLRSLAGELGLALDSFVFIDDDPVECAEVRAHCPEALVVQMPGRGDIGAVVQHHWALDAPAATEESKQRAAYYRDGLERSKLAEQVETLRDFIRNLEIQIGVSLINESVLARVSELSYRTNQFNTTGKRFSIAELAAALASPALDGRVFRVKDRFGDYGLVGAMLFYTEVSRLTIQSMWLSCRALARGVEYRMIAEAGRVAMALGLQQVAIQLAPTDRNRPARVFLERAVGDPAVVSNLSEYVLSAGAAARADEQDWLSHSNPPAPATEVRADSGRPARSPAWQFSSERLMQIAAELQTGSRIVEAARSQREQRIPSVNVASVRTETEKRMARLWSEVLGLEDVVVDEDFFALGGDSLTGVRLLSRLRSEFGVELPMSLLFEDEPTVARLAALIDSSIITNR